MDRALIKYQAKEAMRAAKPHPSIVALVFFLISSAVPSIISGILSITVGSLSNSYAAEGIIAFIPMVFSLLALPIMYGLIKYFIHISRGQHADIPMLFSMFPYFGKILGMNILIALSCTVPMMVVMIPLVFLSILSGGLFIVFAYILSIVAAGYFSLGFMFAPHILVDNPELGVFECMSRSWQLMKGRRGDFFLLVLSFFGWLLLSTFTFGILSLWVIPYMYTTFAICYNILTGQQQAPINNDYYGNSGGEQYNNGYPPYDDPYSQNYSQNANNQGQNQQSYGQYPDNQGQYQQSYGQYPDNQGQYQHGYGQYPDNQGQYQQNYGQYPDNQGQYQNQQPSQQNSYSDPYGQENNQPPFNAPTNPVTPGGASQEPQQSAQPPVMPAQSPLPNVAQPPRSTSAPHFGDSPEKPAADDFGWGFDNWKSKQENNDDELV